MAKFLLDQSVGSVVNILFFIVLITLLQGGGLRGCWEAVLVVCFFADGDLVMMLMLIRTSNRS